MEASDTVGELLTLQEIDFDIVKIEARLSELREEVVGLKVVVDELEKQELHWEGKMSEAEERVRKYQRSVEAGRATLKRLETRTAAVANMQQHFAVRSESDTARRNLRTAEDEQLAAMQEVETARAKLSETQTELMAGRERLDHQGGEAETAASGLETELQSRSSRRKDQEQRIDARTLRLYQSVSGGRRAALASLTEDGVCGRCFTTVPKQRQADIRAGRGLEVCEGCGVILHPEVSSA